MSRVCDITGTRYQSGNNVSHSNRRTRRRFVPNLHNVTVFSDILKENVKLRVTAATLRTIDKKGGLDNLLIATPIEKLYEIGANLKRRINKARAQAE